MRSIRKKILPLLVLAGAGMALACRTEAQTQTPLQALQAEVSRLQGVLKKLDEATPAQGKGELAELGQQLDQIRQQKSPSVLVYRLRNPFVEIEQRSFLLAHRDAGKDFSRLETLWTAEKARFAAGSRPAPAAPLLAALAQMSENYAEKLYRAALPYGKAAGSGAGVYYLGEAEGHMAFRAFVTGLTLPASAEDAEKVPDAAPLRAALESLEGELQKDFAADPGSQEMVPASALLKEARELVERDFRAGAAVALLRSRLELSRHRKGGAAAPAASPAGAAEKVVEGSLIAPFAALTNGEQNETARLVRADVIPLYHSFFRTSK